MIATQAGRPAIKGKGTKNGGGAHKRSTSNSANLIRYLEKFVRYYKSIRNLHL